MNKRIYNVFFNMHTVSGIVISVALYIIFFAGAFSFFKDDIKIWQEGIPISHIQKSAIDYDKILEEFDKKYELLGRDLRLTFDDNSDEIAVLMSASKDSLASKKGKQSHFFYKNIVGKQENTYPENYSLGEFLFRLHFLDQIKYPIGRYLSGLVAFFFLFAIVTGIIVHWKKIIPNFYSFNPKAILKRVWTDVHTALGVIGLPFQFIFAVTGAYFMLKMLVLIPANFLYNGNQTKLMNDLLPSHKKYEWVARSNQKPLHFNIFAKKTTTHWKNAHLTRVFIKNYGGTNMQYSFIGEIKERERFVGLGRLIFDAYSGEIISEKKPTELTYIEDSQRFASRLHFGDFNGITTKIIYFILAIITCFVIITGVLIWVEARNKKSMTLKQRKYTAKIGHIYLSICLSMLPVTALAFLFVKFTEGMFTDKQTSIYYFYFTTWLVFVLFFRFQRNNYFTNKLSLLLGAIFGFLIPIANGVVSHNWIWTSYTKYQYEILTVDVLWILISMTSLLFYFKIRPKSEMKSTFIKNPID